MEQRAVLTIDDGPAYLEFIERWGETPDGERVRSCPECGRCVGHSPHCPDFTSDFDVSFNVENK